MKVARWILPLSLPMAPFGLWLMSQPYPWNLSGDAAQFWIPSVSLATLMALLNVWILLRASARRLSVVVAFFLSAAAFAYHAIPLARQAAVEDYDGHLVWLFGPDLMYQILVVQLVAAAMLAAWEHRPPWSKRSQDVPGGKAA